MGSVTSRPKRSITSKEIEERRARNQCFFCDEKFYPGHKCSGQVYRLEFMEKEEEDGSQEEVEGEIASLEAATDAQPVISLQALQRLNSFQTMKVTGCVGSQPINILIDSGSTHNFLDVPTAKKLRCELLRIPPLRVAVADGAQLSCQAICRGFNFTLLDVDHTTDIYIVPLGCYDMMLGVQWLSTWDPSFGILRN